LLKKEIRKKVSIVHSNKIDFLSPKSANIIIMNPPYLSFKEAAICYQKNKEPFLSLYGGNKGYEFSLDIVKSAYNVLKDNGYLILEIDHRRSQPIIEEAKKIGFKNFKIKKDLSRLDRIIIFQK